MEALLGIFLRHTLTAAGAVLVSKGVADAATVEAVGGAVATLVGFGLSVRQKKKAGLIK